MATDTAPASIQTTQDAPASAAPPVAGADPLANASAALSAGLAQLAEAPASEETETPPAETAAPDAETPPQEQPEKGTTEDKDDTPEASTEDTTDTTEPALKAKDEAVLNRLKETDPELHSLFFRRLQGIEHRASEAAFQRLRRTQTAAELEGTPMAQDVAALTPEQRTAFLATLPEHQLEIDRAQGAVA
ncbi:MAG TPA: hypothetical protein VNM48_08045, partial [Chloroflexota bacterium]|nr:hypothetical protein [Chloroflexota bacterium]